MEFEIHVQIDDLITNGYVLYNTSIAFQIEIFNEQVEKTENLLPIHLKWKTFCSESKLYPFWLTTGHIAEGNTVLYFTQAKRHRGWR